MYYKFELLLEVVGLAGVRRADDGVILNTRVWGRSSIDIYEYDNGSKKNLTKAYRYYRGLNEFRTTELPLMQSCSAPGYRYIGA